ncbi:peroxisomal membrane protein Pex29p [Trichomonascus vanleenenianus]|uniref:PEX28-32 family peroxisomal membrane protein n=1 Tax=Trichomonascus vanleenenianus TaxID=2268995 RepID=UPI003ECB15B7
MFSLTDAEAPPKKETAPRSSPNRTGTGSATTGSSTLGNVGGSMADKLIERMVSSALPSMAESKLDERLRRQKNRPPFSVQTTSRNFRKMTSRSTALYEVYYLVVEVLWWQNPATTLSILLVYSFLCLNPVLIPVVPLAYLLIAVMVPAYVARHPPEPSELESNPVLACGKPLKEASVPEPVPELSREFFLNVVDTQNAMLDYAEAWDLVAKFVAHFCCFDGDECVSTALFATIVVFLGGYLYLSPLIFHYVPWKASFMLAGWALFGSTYCAAPKKSYEAQAAYNWVSETQSKFEQFASKEFDLVSDSEERQVEIFEHQWFDALANQWIASSFISDVMPVYAGRPLRPPPGLSSLKEVAPPREWQFSDQWWHLDYFPEHWAKEYHFVGPIDDSGEKWVYDNDSKQWRRRRWLRSVVRQSHRSNPAS